MRSFLSFKLRLRLFLVVFALVPLAIIGWNSYESILYERAHQREMDMKVMYLSRSDSFESFLLSIESDLNSIVNSAAYFSEHAEESMEDYVDYLGTLKIKGLSPYFVASSDGIVQYISGKPDLQLVDEFSASRDAKLSIYISGYGENAVLSMIVNWLTDGESIVLAGVDVDRKTLQHVIGGNESGEANDWKIQIGDKAISSEYTLGVDDLSGEDVRRNEVFTDAASSSKSYLITDVLDGRVTIELSSSVPEEDRLLSAVQMKYFIVVMILMGLSTVLALVYASHMYNPVRVIDKRSDKLIEGNLSTRITIWHSGIFRPIVDGFNHIAESTEIDYNKLLNQSMEMIAKQDELLQINQSLESNYDDLKKTNRRLEYSKEKFRTLVENISDLVWVVDDACNIIYINEAFESMLGKKTAEVIGQNFGNLLAAGIDKEKKDHVIKMICDSDVDSMQLWLSKGSGNESEILMTKTVRIFKNGKFAGVQGISRPLSENWLLTQKLTRRSQALEDIRDITRTLATENSMDALFGLIVKKIYELYDVVVCSIRILNDKNALELVNVTGPGSHLLTDKGIDDENDVRFRVLNDNKMVYLEELEDSHLQNYNDIMKAAENAQSLVILPLSDGREKTGVISVLFSEKLPQNELMILSTIGIQSTLAIKKAELYEQQREEFMATIRVLVTAIEAKDAYTEGHSNRVSEFATLIATEMDMTSQEIEDIQFAGLLHDIGKIGIDDFILTKKGRLSPFESDKIKEHPEIGRRILQPIGFSKMIMDGVTLHHKRFDLTGYPQQEVVDELPMSSAIIGVSDALDAMTSNRSYSKGRPLVEAIGEIVKHRETQFAPQVVDSIVRIFESDKSELERIISGKVQVMS